jgi:hypothetical protein
MSSSRKRAIPYPVKKENCSGNQREMFTLLLRKSVNGPFISLRIVSVKLSRLLARFLSMDGSDLGCQLRFISLFIIRSQLVLCSNRQSHHQVPVLSLCM